MQGYNYFLYMTIKGKKEGIILPFYLEIKH